MPNVRASSGMIGTIRLPTSGSRMRLRSRRVNTIVVETAVVLPDANSLSTAALGLAAAAATRTTRRGSGPPSSLRRSWRYCTSSESGPGWKYGASLSWSSGIGSSRRSRKTLSSVSLSFFAWWVMLRASTPGAERPALDGLGEDHRRGADVLGRRLVRGVDLAVVVAAAAELEDVVVGEVLDDPAQPRVGAEEVLADVVAARHRVLLELAVERLVHLLDQHAVDVARQQLVPLAAPDDLDHVPAGAAEQALELLDDLAVAADRAVEALQVAVDDERQVVEAVAGGERDAGDRLGLVHLAVAEERPDALLARVPDAAVLQVAVEPRLVDGGQRAEAHRDRRELPEVGHQPGVRVRAQARCRRPRAGSGRAGPRTGGPRGRRGRRCRAPRGPGRTPGRRRPDRPCP